MVRARGQNGPSAADAGVVLPISENFGDANPVAELALLGGGHTLGFVEVHLKEKRK
jgi:hypothetical protein